MDNSHNPPPPLREPNTEHPTPPSETPDEQKQAEAYVKEAILLIPNLLKLGYRLLRDPRGEFAGQGPAWRAGGLPGMPH